MTIDDLKCNDFTELITEYLEGTLSLEGEAACAAHVEDCPHCSAYLQQMRQTIRVLGSIIDETVTPEIRLQLMDRFRGWVQPTPSVLPDGEDLILQSHFARRAVAAPWPRI